MSYGNDGSKKKRVAIIGVSSFLLVAMVLAVTVGVGFNQDEESESVKGKSHSGTKQVSASMKAIKAVCQPTDYKQTCETSLKNNAGNTTDPKELIKVAFKVAQEHINEAAKKSDVLQDLENDPLTHDALKSCKELMNMSVAELQSSIQKISHDFDLTRLDDTLMDLKTWLSASITYQETCLDGFDNTTTDAGEKMKSALKTAMELSSNSLDIIDGFTSVLTELKIPSNNRRRLLQEELHVLGHAAASNPSWNRPYYPEWASATARRLLSMPTSDIKPDLVVAKDGSGDFRTITEALLQVPTNLKNKTFVLYIKEGVYREYLQFPSNMDNLVVIGDGYEKTRITGNKNFIDGVSTYHTATVSVSGDNFIARNIGFENSAGPEKHQAVALRVSADYAIFYNCSMDGYQDTLYAHTKRQFYRDCYISGTIDYVFGDATSAFQNCTFLIRKPLSNQQNIVTAQGRKQRHQPTAIIIQNSTITAHPELEPVRDQYKNYLGRPWKEFSRTIIMESFIDDLIHPDGWLPWMGDFGLKTCWYAEYNNHGPGAVMTNRVTWNGIKQLTRQHAIDFTPLRFFKSDNWIKSTGIPYSPYLTKASEN